MTQRTSRSPTSAPLGSCYGTKMKTEYDGFPVKSGASGPGWELEDCIACHRSEPDTFEIPKPEERDLVAEGQLLRLHFVITEPPQTPDPPRAERMWVEVCDVLDTGAIRGHLTNEPAYIASLSPGDVIEFEWKHVAQVYVTQDDPRHP